VENADGHGLLKRRLTELIGDAIVLADQAKFDVFNALTLMDNPLFLQELKVTWPCVFFLFFFVDDSRYSSDLEMACSTFICIIGALKHLLG
jgi:hypothetical protein